MQETESGIRYNEDSLTGLTKFLGNPSTQVAGSVLTILSSAVVAPLLPLILALCGNQAERLRIERDLQDLSDRIDQCNTSIPTAVQRDFVRRQLAELAQTVDREKAEFLKCAAVSAASSIDLDASEAGRVSRLIRDLTAEELRFLIECSGKRIRITPEATSLEGAIDVEPGSRDDEIVSGLIALGLLRSPIGTWDDHPGYDQTALAYRIVSFLRTTPSEASS